MNLFDLTGKTALITGAAGGLGTQFARTLSAAGARVLLTDKCVDLFEALTPSLKNFAISEMDITKHESIGEAFKIFKENGERIDICVNNAGTAKLTPLFEDEFNHDPYDSFDKGGLDVWDEVMTLNLRGTWMVTRAVAAHMKDFKIQGSIINIASTLGDRRPMRGAAASCASKAGVIHLTRQLVPELAAHGIRINCLVPGLVQTNLTKAQLSKRGEQIKAHIPLGFIAEPQDLDGALLYFASHQASRYVTGACLTLDGGASWGNPKTLK